MNYQISWWQTDARTSEPDLAAAAIRDGHLSDGPIVAALEAAACEMLDVPYAIAAPSGSMALMMAMLALGLKPGDEVIVPNYTWIASAHAASLLGAKIVLVDVNHERPTIDVDQVASKITSRTRAIVPVHLAGRANDIAALKRITAGTDIAIVEDACQAILSKSPEGYLGTLGTIGCYSLGVAKLLTSGQGGISVTRDPKIYARMRQIKTHGVTTEGTDWELYTQPGYNFKFSDVLASIALRQFERSDERTSHVTAIYRRYEEGLANLPKLRVSPMLVDNGEVPLWTEIETPFLKEIRSLLAAEGIQTRRVHPPLNEVPYYEASPAPNTERYSREILVLPSGPSQPLENVDRVISILRAYALQ
jgi:dTDP-4-amino-4,6-dideoxygalactose transaminase